MPMVLLFIFLLLAISNQGNCLSIPCEHAAYVTHHNNKRYLMSTRLIYNCLLYLLNIWQIIRKEKKRKAFQFYNLYLLEAWLINNCLLDSAKIPYLSKIDIRYQKSTPGYFSRVTTPSIIKLMTLFDVSCDQ